MTNIAHNVKSDRYVQNYKIRPERTIKPKQTKSVQNSNIGLERLNQNFVKFLWESENKKVEEVEKFCFQK